METNRKPLETKQVNFSPMALKLFLVRFLSHTKIARGLCFWTLCCQLIYINAWNLSISSVGGIFVCSNKWHLCFESPVTIVEKAKYSAFSGWAITWLTESMGKNIPCPPPSVAFVIFTPSRVRFKTTSFDDFAMPNFFSDFVCCFWYCFTHSRKCFGRRGGLMTVEQRYVALQL